MKKLLFYLMVLVFAFGCKNTKANSDADNSSKSETVLNAQQTVEKFITDLGNQNFQDAYNLTDNPKWGTEADFSSKDAFGGISATKIIEIEQTENSPEKVTIYADVVYTDNVNGNNQFKQYFYLKKYGDEWKIVDMKLADNNKSDADDNSILGAYTNGTIYLIIYAFENNEDFKGVLLNKDLEFAVVGVYGAKTKNGWTLESVYNKNEEEPQVCDIDLTFNGSKVTLDNPDNCCDFNSTLSKTKEFNAPKAGDYGALEIKKVEDYSFMFSIYTQNGTGTCMGEIPVDGEYATAYGIDGVYVFEDFDYDYRYGCLILITCKGSVISFNEIGMCADHGANCNFDGDYTLD